MWQQRFDRVILGIISLVIYSLQSLAWPLFLGRDAWNYIYYYLDFWSTNPVYHYLMARRTPVAPLLFGTSLTFGGTTFTEVMLAILYCLSILGIYTVGSRFGRKMGLLLALIMTLYPAYGQRFHAIETESPAAALLILLCILAFSTLKAPENWKFISLGLVVVILSLTRPDHIVFMSLAALPFLLPTVYFAKKIRFALLFLVASVPFFLGWSFYNYLRYDDFTLSRGGDAHIPFQRAFEFSHTVSAENGPASADLAKTIEAELLNKEPYKSYKVDINSFFSRGTERMFYDLPTLSDMHYGWDSDYSQIKRAGIEAVIAHPLPFFWSYIKSAGVMLLFNSTQPASSFETGKDTQAKVGPNGLPIPTEGDLIPRSYYLYIYSAPTPKSRPDPNLIELKIVDPEMRSKTAEMEARIEVFRKSIPNRNGMPSVAAVFNFLTIMFPPAIVWIFLGFFGAIMNPSREKLLLAIICCLSLIIVLYTILGINPVPIMRVRFDPLFILIGLLGCLELKKLFVSRKTVQDGKVQ